MARIKPGIGHGIAVVLVTNGCVLPNDFRATDAGASGRGGTTASTNHAGAPTSSVTLGGNEAVTTATAITSGGTASVGSVTTGNATAGTAGDHGGTESAAGSGNSIAAGGTSSSQSSVTGFGGNVHGGAGASASGGSMPGGATFGGSTNGGATSAVSGGMTSAGGASSTAGTTGGMTSAGGTSSMAGTTSATTGGVSTAGSGAVSLENCVLLLHMDEAAWTDATGRVQDASGLGNHGTAVSGVTTGSLARFARAGSFSGSGYVSIGDNASLRPTNALTVTAWVYPTALDGNASPGIVTKRWAYGNAAAFTLFFWLDNRLYADIDVEDDRFLSVFQFTNNSWYHVALIYDGTLPAAERARFYVNGTLDSVHAVTSDTIQAFDSPLEIGRLRDGGSIFTGAIDEVAIWRRALTASEVSALYFATGPL